MSVTPSLDPAFVRLLRCPVTRLPLRLLSRAEWEAAAGGAPAIAGEVDAVLLREDGRVWYPVRGGIPVLLAEEGVPLAGGLQRNP